MVGSYSERALWYDPQAALHPLFLRGIHCPEQKDCSLRADRVFPNPAQGRASPIARLFQAPPTSRFEAAVHGPNDSKDACHGQATKIKPYQVPRRSDGSGDGLTTGIFDVPVDQRQSGCFPYPLSSPRTVFALSLAKTFHVGAGRLNVRTNRNWLQSCDIN